MAFINQTSATFDQFETEPATPFGQGVRFHASIRLEFRGQKKFPLKLNPQGGPLTQADTLFQALKEQ